MRWGVIFSIMLAVSTVLAAGGPGGSQGQANQELRLQNVEQSMERLCEQGTFRMQERERYEQITQNVCGNTELQIKAARHIENRNRLQYFFAGGDEEAADEILGLVQQNREQVRLMEQLRSEALDNDTRSQLSEQIRALASEQNHLEQLANQERVRLSVWARMGQWFR